MAALLVDTLSLDDIRRAIVAGKIDAALQSLDCLTATAPRSEERQATPKQRWYINSLVGLQGGGWASKWKNCLLPMHEASRMIQELTTEGVTVYEGERYILSEKAARKMGKKTDALHDGIPW